MGKGIAIMLGGPPGKDKDEDESPDSSGEASEEALEAATDFADAVKSGDPEAIVLAFKALKMSCEG
jgi:hypothetical protein